jgi:hypothetical protein
LIVVVFWVFAVGCFFYTFAEKEKDGEDLDGFYNSVDISGMDFIATCCNKSRKHKIGR